jgi:predicted DNA-binding transcriptional regulator YafY
MKLFQKIQSRSMQFALSVMAKLKASGTVSGKELDHLAKECGLEYADQVLPDLMKSFPLKQDKKGLHATEEFSSPALPLSNLEEEYLSRILRAPEAALFLDAQEREQLAVNPADPFFTACAEGTPFPPPNITPKELHTILTAIEEKRSLHYCYRTTNDPTCQKTTALPWKLEFDARIHRWCIILYELNQHRMIKAILHNLSHLELGDPVDISDRQLHGALDALLESEALVLSILPQRNALERCAMVFERQMLRRIEPAPDGTYQLTFRYYRFQEPEILRNLLYLGPAVRLVAPTSMQQKLTDLLHQALN